jgi:N-formylglutamate amidohydrolase
VESTSQHADAEGLSAADVGLAPGAPLPFRFVPARSWSPLVISFPHVGLEWPPELHGRPHVSLARNADFGVDSVYDGATELGAATISARFTRLVVDLNRAEDDVSPDLVPDHPAPRPRVAPAGLVRSGRGSTHRGVIWGNAVGNIPVITGTLPYAHLHDRLERYYRPYFRALEHLLERRRAHFGHAVLLDAHSMPSSVPGDMILGTQGGTSCSAGLLRAALDALSTPGGLDVRVDDPYGGGHLVRAFGRPQAGLHALQLELSRDLYMDELRLELWTQPTHSAHPRASLSAPTRHRVCSLVRALASASPGPG